MFSYQILFVRETFLSTSFQVFSRFFINFHCLECFLGSTPFHKLCCYLVYMTFLTHTVLKQACDTWCNIANVHELSGHDYQEVRDAYFKALEYAEMSAKPNVIVSGKYCN